jgi:oxalate decarboxylase/phosphoglucose isomerase-like protein (cupin superfamily)
MMYTPIIVLTSLLSLTPSVFAAKALNPNLNAMLKMAATNYDRHALLASDNDWAYDFFTHRDYNNTLGSVITADAATFPALTGLGISYALLKLGPCSMLPPHFHQRAHNAVIGIKGNTTSWMINENGVRTVKIDIIPFRMTIFPQGSLHVMQNNGEFFTSLSDCAD